MSKHTAEEMESVLRQLTEDNHQIAVDHGFWDLQPEHLYFPAALCEIHRRLSDAMEADRRGEHAEAVRNLVMASRDLTSLLEEYADEQTCQWIGTVIQRINATKLCLIHSEVSEAFTALLSGNTEDLADKVSDIQIRSFDLAGGLHFNTDHRLLDKMSFNITRPHRHGNKRY